MTPNVMIIHAQQNWANDWTHVQKETALNHLEAGKILLFEDLPFALQEQEYVFTADQAPELLNGAKNASFDLRTDSLKGVTVSKETEVILHGMMKRYAQACVGLVKDLLPQYSSGIEVGRTSYRPMEVSGRNTSWRKDDTRLHVDAFPATPVQGKRILRVFCNIHPNNKARHWRVGNSAFDTLAQQFFPTLPTPLLGSARFMKIFHITKALRTPYDHYMLKLHDGMKADSHYQTASAQEDYFFPAQTTWMVFTDQVPHAAMSGQFMLEQTFYVPVEVLAYPEQSPLRVLEKIAQRKLV